MRTITTYKIFFRCLLLLVIMLIMLALTRLAVQAETSYKSGTGAQTLANISTSF